MPARVVRDDPEAREERLTHVVRRGPAVRAALHAPVLGDGPKAVEDPPHRHPGQPPQQRVDPPTAGGDPHDRPQHGLDPKDREADGAEWLRSCVLYERYEVLPPADPDSIAEESPAEGPARTGVGGVEGDVGLVRTEFVL